jgi:archaemetzincin
MSGLYSGARQPLELVSIGRLPSDLLPWLGEELDHRLATCSRLGASLPLRSEWWDAKREQYNSNRIVDALVERLPGDPAGTFQTGWTLGVTEADLYMPERNFVFGEATVGGCCALISLARLRPIGASLPNASPLFRSRILKEAMHELGHVAGLPHCSRSRCVMSPSDAAEKVDRKEAAFCGVCFEAVPKLSPRT